mgnify:CR=1 FL=1
MTPKRNCKTCDGSGIATGHYKAACRSPHCTGPMFIPCPSCAGIPFSVDMRCNFVGACSPKQKVGECADCGDPAPIGLYQCEACRHAEAGFND